MEKRNFFDAVPFDGDLILPRLYLGSLDSANNLNELKKRDITHIVNISHDLKPEFPKKIDYLHILAEDSLEQNLLCVLIIAIEFIHEVLSNQKKGSVLVHCGAGISRSSSLVIAYLMKMYNKSFLEAWQHTKERRSWACPNSNFQRQLQLFEEMGCVLDTEHSKFKEVQSLPKPQIERWHKGKKNAVEY